MATFSDDPDCSLTAQSIALSRWKMLVTFIDLSEQKFQKLCNERKITNKEKKKIEGKFEDLWIKVWDFYPDKNPSIEKAFKDNFC
jgi:hypothetical protein